MQKQEENRILSSIIVERKEFFVFIRKFVGLLISKGNKSRAINMFDDILYFIKRKLKKNPIVILYIVFQKLVPVFSISYKRVGNRYQPVPGLASKNMRIVLILTWLIRNLKGKSNIRGVRAVDIARIIIETYRDKGRALADKRSFYRKALSGRHLLSTNKQKNKKFSLKKKKKQVVEF